MAKIPLAIDGANTRDRKQQQGNSHHRWGKNEPEHNQYEGAKVIGPSTCQMAGIDEGVRHIQNLLLRASLPVFNSFNVPRLTSQRA